MHALVLPVMIRLPLHKKLNIETMRSEKNTPYIQSIRSSFSRIVPGGVRNFRKTATKKAATPQTGRFKSGIRHRCQHLAAKRLEYDAKCLQNSQRHCPASVRAPPTKGPIAQAIAHVLLDCEYGSNRLREYLQADQSVVHRTFLQRYHVGQYYTSERQ